MERLRTAAATAVVVAGALVSVIVAHDAPAAASGTPASVLNGVYRVQYTEKELVALGTTARYAKQNYGLNTLWLTNGRYRVRQSRYPAACVGSYTVSGKRVTFDLNVPHCRGIVTAAWSFQPGSLRFRVIEATDPGDIQLWGSRPWKKIG
jgi:hypothetical protein